MRTFTNVFYSGLSRMEKLLESSCFALVLTSFTSKTSPDHCFVGSNESHMHPSNQRSSQFHCSYLFSAHSCFPRCKTPMVFLWSPFQLCVDVFPFFRPKLKLCRLKWSKCLLHLTRKLEWVSHFFPLIGSELTGLLAALWRSPARFTTTLRELYKQRRQRGGKHTSPSFRAILSYHCIRSNPTCLAC